ncbi:MAG TPA: hypothetical protein VLJ37_11860 [bacterium]|nr:hypothetical protein [bacterium]
MPRGARAVVLALLFLLGAGGCAHGPRRVSRVHERTLLIALDGVPFGLVSELKKEGRFSEFQEPARVVSTFPSTSHSGFGGLFRPLGASPPPGYDREYYSYADEKIIGFLSSIHPKNPHDFKNFFDYSRKTPLQKFWIYAAPGLSGRRDLEKIRRLVWSRGDDRPLFTYIGGTDGAGHVLGRKRLKRWLIFMDGYLQRMKADYLRDFGQTLQISLYSDHGFHFIRRPNAVSQNRIENGLRRERLHLAPNLKTPDRVVAVQWGNISGASLFVDETRVPDVARVLAGTAGIDITAYRSGEDIIVLSQDGGRLHTARVSCTEGRRRCRYAPVDGDPLDYGDIVDSLRRKGRMDSHGFAASEDWFEATKDRRYPDALYRLHDGFFSLVENPAPILFSTEDDYEYGDVLTRIGAWFHGGLKGTHGGLFQEASAAFAMTTDSKVRLPSVLRYDQVMPYIVPHTNLPFRTLDVREGLKRAHRDF